MTIIAVVSSEASQAWTAASRVAAKPAASGAIGSHSFAGVADCDWIADASTKNAQMVAQPFRAAMAGRKAGPTRLTRVIFSGSAARRRESHRAWSDRKSTRLNYSHRT